MKKIFLFVFMGLGFFCIGGCSKDHSPTKTQPVAPQLPDAAAVKTNLPKNAAVQVRSLYDEVYISLSGTLQHFEKVKNQIPQYNNFIWAWTYSSAGYNITLEAAALAGDSSSWKILLSGNSLNNWISATGKAIANGKYGAWRFYFYNSTTLQGSASWQKNERNILVIDATKFRDLNPTDDIPGYFVDIKLIGNADNSGSLKATERGVKTFESMWEASGAGSWAAYDPSTGHQTDGGSWGPG